MAKRNEVVDDTDDIEDLDEDEEIEDEELEKMEESPAKPVKKANSIQELKRQNVNARQQPKYTPFIQQERAGVVDNDSNELIDALTFQALVLNKLDELKKTIGNI